MKFWKTADICEVAVTKTLFRVCGGIGFGMEMRQRLNRKISIVRELRINPKKIAHPFKEWHSLFKQLEKLTNTGKSLLFK
jgi:hypothetical protein